MPQEKTYEFKMAEGDFEFLFDHAAQEASKAQWSKDELDDILATHVAGTSGLSASVNWTNLTLGMAWSGGAKPFGLALYQSNMSNLIVFAARDCAGDGDLEAKLEQIADIYDGATSGQSTSVNWTASPVTVSVNWT